MAAIKLADRAVRNDPANTKSWRVLALASYRNEKYESAETANMESLKFTKEDKQSAYNWLLQSMIHTKRGETDEAERWYVRAKKQITNENAPDDDLFHLAQEAAATLNTSQHPSGLSNP